MADTLPDKELLSLAIKVSGLSVRRFARERLVREPRTVWRWLAGENDLPRAVRETLVEYVATTPMPPGVDVSTPIEEGEEE
jgi:hypothetical protein